MTPVFASIEDVVYDASTILRIPVLILALAALAVVVVELGEPDRRAHPPPPA